MNRITPEENWIAISHPQFEDEEEPEEKDE
jgi:hypothetical protein